MRRPPGRLTRRNVEARKEEPDGIDAAEPGLARREDHPQSETIAYWIVTALFCLQMSFTAYAQLRLPQVAEAFIHLGFPAYFRVELAWAKLLGVAAAACAGAAAAQGVGLRRLRHRPGLGAHRPPRRRRWPEAWGWAAGTGVLWALSYVFWRRFRPRKTVELT